VKLPSLRPVACFAGGILLSGKCMARWYLTPRLSLLVAGFLLLFGFILLYKGCLLPAGIAATAAWLCLGCAARSLERISVPANLASSLMEITAARLPQSSCSCRDRIRHSRRFAAGRDDSFGHPYPEVVERLKAAGVCVYLTARDGAITATTDGQTLTVSTFHASHQCGRDFIAATPSGSKGSPSQLQAR
jgi:hypothetical protein